MRRFNPFYTSRINQCRDSFSEMCESTSPNSAVVQFPTISLESEQNVTGMQRVSAKATKTKPSSKNKQLKITVAIIFTLLILVISLSITLIFTLLHNRRGSEVLLRNNTIASSTPDAETGQNYKDYDGDYYYDQDLNTPPQGPIEKAEFIPDTVYTEPGMFYRINPLHFADSNNDGAGDLRGISDFLPYLEYMKVQPLHLLLSVICHLWPRNLRPS